MLPATATKATAETQDNNYQYVTQWNNNNIKKPGGIAVDKEGYVYVTDLNDQQIHKYTPNGDKISSFGNNLDANMVKLNQPEAIAVDKDGFIYVVDALTKVVDKISPEGKLITSWPTQTVTAKSIAVDNKGYLYLVDYDKSRIIKFSTSGEYITAFGRYGQDESDFFGYPAGIAVDASGNVFVSNYNVSRFTSDGKFLSKWGASGNEAIAVDNQGYTYVVDKNSYAINKLDSNGTIVTQWGRTGDADEKLKAPIGIALDNNGNVYVLDFYTGVKKYTSEGKFLTKWGKAFNFPQGVAVDSDDNIYVVDSNEYGVKKLTKYGQLIAKWGSYGTGNGQFKQPKGIAISKNGYVYISDTTNNTIQKFTLQGEFIAKWGSTGSGDGQFTTPSALAVDEQDNVFVCDTVNHRIQKFTSNGIFISKFRVNSSFPKGIAIFPDGQIIVAASQLEKFDPTGKYLGDFAMYGSQDGQVTSASAVAIDNLNKVYVADAYLGRIQVFTSTGEFIAKFGTFGANPGQFNNPNGLAVDSLGDIYIGDSVNYRVQKYTLNNFPPVSNIQITPSLPDGENQWYQTQPTITLANAENGINKYSWDNRENWLDYQDPITSPVGKHYLNYYVKVDDNKIEEVKSQYLKVDTEKPVGSVTVNQGETITNNPELNLTLTATDEISGLDKIQVSADPDFTEASWESYSAVKQFIVSPEDGLKTVYVRLKDIAGNVSETYSAEITLDSTLPNVGVEINTGDKYTNHRLVQLQLQTDNLPEGYVEMKVANDLSFRDTEWENVANSKEWLLSAGDGPKVVYIKFRDGLGKETQVIKDSITLDTHGPFGSVYIPTLYDGYSAYNNVNLKITAFDGTSDVESMQIANEPTFANSPWESFNATKLWTTSNDIGLKTIYIRFKDNAGNQSPVYTYTFGFFDKLYTGKIVINKTRLYINYNTVELQFPNQVNLPGVNSMMISNDPLFKDGVWENYFTSKKWTLSPGDGVKRVYVKFKDSSDIETETYYDTVILDTQAPAGNIAIDNVQVSNQLVNLSLKISAADLTSGVTEMLVATTPDFTNRIWERFNSIKHWSMPLSDVSTKFYVKFRDRLGNVSPVSVAELQTENLLADGKVLTVAYTNQRNILLNISNTGFATGMNEMKVADTPDFINAQWEPFSGNKVWKLSDGDGTKTIYVKFRDNDGIETPTYSTTTILDTSKPVGKVVVNDNNYSTNNTVIKLNLPVEDSSGVKEMLIATNPDFYFTSWEKYSSSREWLLPTGDGKKTVYVKFRDNLGYESEVFTDEIILDTLAPSLKVAINNGALFSKSGLVNLSFTFNGTTALDDKAIAKDYQMQVSNDSTFAGSTWRTYAPSLAWNLTAGDGAKIVYVKIKDQIGNTSVFSQKITVDSKGPVGKVLINNNGISTKSRSVTVTLSATDTSGLAQMLIGNDATFKGSTWVTYTTKKAWTLSLGYGTKAVYVKFKDKLGNISTVYSDKINLIR